MPVGPARPVASWSGVALRRRLFREQSGLALEVVRVLETLVDACEAQVGDVVKLSKVFEDGNAELLARDFRSGATDEILDRVHEARDLRSRHGAVFAGRSDTRPHLLAVERFTLPGPLRHERRRTSRPLESREPRATEQALAPAANGRTVLHLTRIDNPVVSVGTTRTPHTATLPFLAPTSGAITGFGR